MNHRFRRPTSKWPKVPPWIILVTVLGAMVLAGIMFSRDYRREQGHLREMFLQRGEVLIHSLEMLSRVRFGERLEEDHLQAFWNNLEDNDNILFLALTDEAGQPLVLVGDIAPELMTFQNPQIPAYAGGAISPSFRVEKIDDRWVYLVYRPFWSLPRKVRAEGRRHAGRGQHSGPGRVHGDQGTNSALTLSPPSGPGQGRGSLPRRYLWVGFDLASYEKISHSRVRTAAVFIGLFCLAGLGGVLALFWSHNSRLARQMYQDTNALAGELIGRLPTGVILKDSQGRVTLVNQATLAISGLPEKAFLGQSLETLTAGRFPVEETLTGREVDLSFAGGPPVRVALTAGPVISDDGHPLGQVILMEDLGELGRLKAELTKKERLAALGGLAAGLAHEIRNPLGAIRGLSQHLLTRLTAAPVADGEPGRPVDAGDREALEVMLASVDRLNTTITDFLEYSRPTEVRSEPLDLAELTRQMATLAGHDARGQAVDIALNLPQSPVIIEGDEAHLSRALLNLYLNAIEAAGSGGGGGRLTVGLAAVDHRVILTFHDNGPGFSPGQLAQPFVPYFTTKAEGTGLGLAMVEKTIRAHPGADITLATPPSGGGLVTISFQLYESEPHESCRQTSGADS